MKRGIPSFNDWKKKQKKRDYVDRKYGELDHISKKNMLERSAKTMKKNATKPERKMATILTEMNIPFETQKVLGTFIYDIFIEKYNLFIEVDGDYFHGNPAKYKKEDLNMDQIKSQQHDIMKTNLAEGLQYGLLRFWESEINSNPKAVKETIRKYLKNKNG